MLRQFGDTITLRWIYCGSCQGCDSLESYTSLELLASDETTAGMRGKRSEGQAPLSGDSLRWGQGSVPVSPEIQRTGPAKVLSLHCILFCKKTNFLVLGSVPTVSDLASIKATNAEALCIPARVSRESYKEVFKFF